MIDSLWAAIGWQPIGWFEYLLVYMTPGLLLLAYFLINKWRERPSEFARAIMKTVGKETSLVDQLKECLVYVIATLCILLGWPAFLIWLPFNIAQQKRNEEWQALPDFDCAPEYLVAQVNPIDAELASYIVDPLGTVPAVPFGHLNQGWANFLAEMTDPTEEIWSFCIPKGSKTGKYQFEATSETRGYARVRDGKILGEFIYERD
ncbi:hypothetical protein [Polynucleobacter sp. MWH-UH2A]|uniref:hypothetical protein n=1 Tax=Polynucleobacter sp. MWH-UH2A TaxID=1855617 RepID=UPI001BFE84E9|nr:hypothetical protein [Polynucleobacter sp. MWH-UH2A]QWD63374.1 hypothetical protein IC571_06645 [Polynucleobacter sp. MWH-UH2A]